jgi:6-phosphogluconolactonase
MPVASGPSTFTVGGAVSRMIAGTQLILDDNGADALTVGANGAFTFSSPVPLDGSFAVTVGTQPAGQVCTVSSGSGSGVTANVTGVSVSCAGSPEFAYVANVNTNTVSQYAIGLGGALTALSPATVPGGSAPALVAVDPSGHFAYVTDAASRTVSQYAIGSDGALTALGLATVQTGNEPQSLTVDPSDRFAYLVDGFDSTVSQYTIGADGALAPISPATVSTSGPVSVVTVRP